MSADKPLDPAELLAAARRETGLSAFDTRRSMSHWSA
jgi:hypothetical protein